MHIDIRTKLLGGELEQAWRLYYDAFRELDALAVQRHLMYRTEFDDVASDERIEKRIATVEGQLIGLSTFTNHLDAWPLISTAYFKRRWPVQFEAKTIWYCGFVAVTNAGRTSAGAYTAMIENMYRQAEEQGGIICLDFCAHNDTFRHIGKSIRLSLTRISGGKVAVTQMDQQTFMAYLTDTMLC